MKAPNSGSGAPPPNVSDAEGEKKSINGELWQACAGPLANLPAAGTHVVYFPQGHSEQVAASMKKDVNAQIPNYPNLPSKLICLLHDVTLLADPETDEVYVQMTLQPVPSFDKDSLLRSDLSMKVNKPQTEFFCKTLTASDTSTHGGFSVPRRAAEKIFPSLDFSMQPPAQEIVARDLHDTVWTFRHIFRGQPKRHLLTTGWSLFVSGKRLIAGDSVLFIRDEKQQLLLGIRRANRQPTNLSSSVLSSDSMHIGVLAAAAHAAANSSLFTVFYNPRSSPSEFVIPLAKYYKAVCSNQISLGMRFRMMFETDESGTRRYMGTITGISDLDAVSWKNSQWRNLQVGWDESTTGERRNRVSIWEIEPVTAPFFMCPTPPFLHPKRSRQPGMPDDDSSDLDNLFRRTMPWAGNELGLKDSQPLHGLSLVQWANMQPNSSMANSMHSNYINPLPSSVMQNFAGSDISRQLGLPSTQVPHPHTIQLNAQRPNESLQQLDQFKKAQSPLNNMSSTLQTQHQLTNITHPSRQNLGGQTLQSSQVQSQNHSQPQDFLQHQQSLLNHHLQQNLSQQQQQQHQQQQHHQRQQQQQQQQQQHQQQQQQQIPAHPQQQNPMPCQLPDHTSQQLNISDNQIQLQLLQKLHQHQQSHLARQSVSQHSSQFTQLHEQQKQLLEIPPSLLRSMTSNQISDSSQATETSSMHPHSHATDQQIARSNSQFNPQCSQLPQQPKLQQQQHQSGSLSDFPGHVGATLKSVTSQHSAGSASLLTGAAGWVQPAVNDDVPSCSTSISTNNCHNAVGTTIEDEIAKSSASLLNSSGLEQMSSNGHIVKDLHQKSNVKPSLNVSKNQNHGLVASQTFLNAAGTQIDYLDSSSSVTSVFSQNEGQIPQDNSITFNSQSVLFRHASQDTEVLGDPRSKLPFGTRIDIQPLMPHPLVTKDRVGSGKDFVNDLSSAGGEISNYETPKDGRAELSSSMLSQSFGVPDMPFSSPINDDSFVNRGAWAAPQILRMRTYTKVYKRGAVGRSIDIARYSGYDELNQDLARRFGIEGQLEDRQRIGWKLVYVDNENDVLLVGDDPWEEFVSCVRCIKILSPQEVQQMSLDGDFGDNVLPNQACSSSDNGAN